VNATGDYVGVVALALLVYAETGDPLATTALFIATQFLPAFIAPALTARADQVPLRRILPLLYASEAAIFVALALLANAFSLALVLVLALVDGALMLTARALVRSAINVTLQPVGLLREGNGLINVGFAAASIGGAALGGVLVGAYGVGVALSVDALSFAAVAILLLTGPLPTGGTETREPMFRLMREGLQFAAQQPTARALLLGEAVALVLFTLIVPIEVVYARETLGTNDAGYGLLLAAWGAGIVLGSFVFLWVRQRSAIARILLSTLAIGVAYLGMAFARDLWLACAISVVGGLGNGIQWVSVMTAVQEVTPERLQARVVGLLESIASIMTGVGFLLGGLITATASPPAAFAVAGTGIVVLVVAGTITSIMSPTAVAASASSEPGLDTAGEPLSGGPPGGRGDPVEVSDRSGP
jgi:predicted MFS family arabinose efflux permease